jgi:hypothetical protein
MSPNLRKSQKLFHTGREDKRNLSLEKIQNSEAAKSRERKVPVFYSQKYEHSELKLPRNDKYSKLYKQYSTHTASIAGNRNPFFSQQNSYSLDKSTGKIHNRLYDETFSRKQARTNIYDPSHRERAEQAECTFSPNLGRKK